MSELLRETQAAERLGRSAGTLKRWRAKGYGPAFIRMGGRTPMYRPEAITKWLEANETEPVASQGGAE